MSNERIQQARQLWERFPGNELARFNLAQALFDAGHHREAATHLEALCAGKPDWMVVHILLGKCRQFEGDRVAARRWFERAHELAVRQHHDGPREELEQLLRELSEPTKSG